MAFANKYSSERVLYIVNYQLKEDRFSLMGEFSTWGEVRSEMNNHNEKP